MVKNLLKIVSLFIISVAFFSCEDVVDIDLETAEPKLVIDASLKWPKGTSGNEQTIKLTTTTGFYENIIPFVTGATVFVTNGNKRFFVTECRRKKRGAVIKNVALSQRA